MGHFQTSLRGDTTSLDVLKTTALNPCPPEVTCSMPHHQPVAKPRPSQSPFINNKKFYSSVCVRRTEGMRT